MNITHPCAPPPCFFYVVRPPQGCTLFPYTTLFRSIRFEGSLGYFGLGVIDGPEVVVNGRVGWSVCENMMSDRKSTRLNSSHQIISYAVFCLKKKTRRLR